MVFRGGHPADAGPDWLEILAATAISIAGLGTSWSAYQAALWTAVQTLHYGKANAARVSAAQFTLRAATTEAWEVGLVRAWLEAKEGGKDNLATFYEQRIPPDLSPAFSEWVGQRPLENPDAATGPFRLPSYRNPDLEKAQALEASAGAEFAAGQDANRTSNTFTQGSLILATAMFFGGIGQVFRWRGLRAVLCLMSVLACLWGLESIFTLPTRALGPR